MNASNIPSLDQLEHRLEDLTFTNEDRSTSGSDDHDRNSLNSNSQSQQRNEDESNFTPPTEGLGHVKDTLFQALPMDIIELIFYGACKFNPHTWRRGLHPFKLANVCQTWRNFLLSSPLLWDTVVLNLPLSNGPVEIEILREWLARAEVRPLNIFITYRFSPQDLTISSSMTMDVFTTLLQVSAQWQVLWLEIPPIWFSLYNLQCLPPLPLLHSLTMKMVNAELGNSHMNFAIDVPSAPKLTHLGVAGIEAHTLSLPWKQIQSLNIERTPSVTTHAILSKCCRLKQAIVSNPIFTNYPVIQPSTNPLTSLAVYEAANEPTFELTFQYLTFPNMASLSITLQAGLYAPKSIFRLIQRSHCHLTRLDFGCSISREDNLVDLLTELYTLQELHLTHLPLSPLDPPRFPEYPSTQSNPRSHRNTYRDSCSTYYIPRYGLTSVFFEAMHPDIDSFYLHKLEVFTYEGPLIIHAIDVLEPLILRTGVRGKGDELDQPPGFSGDSEVITPKTSLRKVKIRADQKDDQGVIAFTIAEYTDASYVWDIIQLVEAGTFELVNMDGSMWL